MACVQKKIFANMFRRNIFVCENVFVYVQACGHPGPHNIQWVKVITMCSGSQVESDYFTVFV